ncbi:TAXI family TRAP transporter solute-binding subunit [Pararhizobium haloflavum]|uniref:TAXI family TRAP transporter solute-binding subunit n=1 Tax=Pararhizobium haloflavum TaxID=2037914 RepID=UPI000C192E2F|nr:TAXI family TRAP transporter solute-binding subunit [Pararhizobium haloflavum]
MKHALSTLILAASVAFTGPAFAQAVGIATSNPGSLFHNIGTAVANAANEAGLNATIQPATSPNQYIPLVGSGGIEFGAANLQEVNYALEGREWFEGAASPDLRIVGVIMPLVEAIFVRADSDIQTIADLEGQPMVDGYTAQNTILPQLDAMYATAGLTRDDMEPVEVASVVAGADAFIAGDAVGFIFAHGAGKVREADAAVGGLRALPIEENEENLATIREHWPVGFFATMEPGPNAPGVTETSTFFAYPQVIFTHAGVPDDVVYEMTKVLYEGKDEMAATFAPFNAFNPDDLAGDIGVSEFHPGALRFFEEAGLLNE